MSAELRLALKQLIIEACDKDCTPADIADDEFLFGPEAPLQLDSLDALQISVALQEHFNVRLQGDRAVRQHMSKIADLAAFVRESHTS